MKGASENACRESQESSGSKRGDGKEQCCKSGI